MVESTKNKEYLNKSIYSNMGSGEVGLAWHNVDQIFPAASKDLRAAIATHYGQRIGHTPDTKRVAVVVHEVTGIIRSQMDYLSDMCGVEMAPIAIDRLNGEFKGVVSVPYINISTTEQMLQSHGTRVWGMPGRLVDVFKNKADCHELITNLGIDGFEVPDYEIVPVNDLESRSKPFLAKIRQNYRDAGMPNYPLGLMFRGAESDGNYGACFIKEIGDQIHLVPNGDSAELERYPNWDEAINRAQHYLLNSANANILKEERVVVSRLMDLEDSPGLSVIITEGNITPLGWNGQVRPVGGSACIGTSTYNPQNERLKQAQLEKEQETTESFENFLRATCRKLHIDFNSISGITNVDLMIPGKLEDEYQRRIGRNPIITIAEINPRWTNYTDALSLIVSANRKEKSPANLLEAARKGVLTIDKYPLPKSANLDHVREVIRRIDRDLQSSGSRIIVRMQDNPMGLVFAGDVTYAKSVLDRAISTL